jgi:Rrf2 family transcriptional regulator, iron-sulfur cluster assembly transcription factor
MTISKTCELAIRALILIAKDTSGEPARVSKLHVDLGIGFSFMTKILQPLTAAGILNSFKGAKGGLVFNRKPENVSVKDVVLAIDGDIIFTRCALGLPECGEPDICEFHEKWTPVRNQLVKTFEETSIADLAKTKSILIS